MRKWYVTMIEKLYFLPHHSCECRGKPFSVEVEARTEKAAIRKGLKHPETPKPWINEAISFESIIQVVGVAACGG